MATQHYRKNSNKVQAFATHRMWMYNHDHPSMALGGIIPKQQLAMAA
jgi:hypothetical protein